MIGEDINTQKPWLAGKNRGKRAELTSFEILGQNAKKVVVRSSYAMTEFSAQLNLVKSVYGNGVVKVTNTINFKNSESLTMLSKYGMQMAISNSYDVLTYSGKGPHENYQGPQLSADIGLFQESVDDNYIPINAHKKVVTKQWCNGSALPIPLVWDCMIPEYWISSA